MKKILYSSTALAAASALALIPSGDAVAAEKAKKISLGLGGGMTMLMGFADQADSFEKSSAADVAGTTHYDSFGLWSNTEVEVKGSVKLDNGITVSVEVEFEGDQVTANGTGVDAAIDHSYMKITGGFGDLRIGSTAPATGVLAQTAPFTGAILPGVEDLFWVMKPAAVTIGGAPGKIGTSNGSGDTQKISYISPQFAGLRLGMYYQPSSTATSWEGMPRVGGQSGLESQQYGATLNFEQKFGAVSLKADIGRWRVQGQAIDSVNDTRFGARIGFGDITIGGSYNWAGNEDTGIEGTASSDEAERYDIGILFKSKGYSVGLHHIHARRPFASATSGDDSKSIVSLGAAYEMGPGVNLVGTIAYVEYSDELTNDSNNNEGWALIGGIKVAF